MGQPVQEEVTILELLNKKRVKVRYLPQSIAASLEYDHGSPVTPPGTRKPKFDYHKWQREVIPKMNDLALKNIQIVEDLSKNLAEIPKNGVRLSMISPGEFRRLQELCFPGATENPDSEEQDDAPRSKKRKSLRSGQSDPPGQ